MKFSLCPICNSSKTTLFGKRESYVYFLCTTCQHIFIDPMPSEKLLASLYAGNYEFRVDEVSLTRFKEMAQRNIDKFMQINPSGKTLLDIGAGYGTFVKAARSRGLNAIGIEPAINLHIASRSEHVIHTDLNQFIRTNKKKFDYITSIHVIEHMKDPDNFMRAVLKLLNYRGVLYIETPNAHSHLAMVEKESYTFLTPPDHLNLFSKHSFQLLIDSIDTKLIAHYSTYSYPEHLVGILRTLKHAHLPVPTPGRSGKKRGLAHRFKLPFFDRVVAPVLAPLLNIGNKGSFLQIFIQKKI